MYQFNGTTYAWGSRGAGGQSATGYIGYGVDTDIAGEGPNAGVDGMMFSDEGSASYNNTGSGGWGRGYVGVIGSGQYSTSTTASSPAHTINARANSGGGGGGDGKGHYATPNQCGNGGSGVVIVRVAV
jgi:hypothetical protein